MIETHCHLDYLKERELKETLALASESGVEKIMTISVSPDNLDTVLEIAKSHEQIFCTQGIHPHQAKEATEETFNKIIRNSKDTRVVAIGEIGYDFHYNHSPRSDQEKVFERLLLVSVDQDLPVVIHTRDADQETLAMLKKYPKARGVVHSFTSSQELAEEVLSMGWHIGFNGIITFKNAQEVRDIVEITPLNRILLETDAPFLSPTPHRGKENGPHRLVHIAKKIAEIKKLPFEEVVSQTTANALGLFTKIH